MVVSKESYKKRKKIFIKDDSIKEDYKDSFLEFLSDFENGLNLPKNITPKGPRKPGTLLKYLNRCHPFLKYIQDKMPLKEFAHSLNGNLGTTEKERKSTIKENKKKIRNTKLTVKEYFDNIGRAGKKTSTDLKVIKGWWHWFMRTKVDEGLLLIDYFEDIGTEEDSPKFVLVYKEDLDKLIEYKKKDANGKEEFVGEEDSQKRNTQKNLIIS